MAQTISKIIIEIGDTDYELYSGGQPAPNSVGSAELQDNSVMLVDLNTEAKDLMHESASAETCESVVDELT